MAPRGRRIVSETISIARDYPWSLQIGDLEIEFRKMVAKDLERMLTFTRSLPERDLLFLRLDITKSSVVEEWITNIENHRTLTILAEERGEIIGYCSLHRTDILWTRHLGEIRLLVGSSYRGKGIGRHLLEQVVPFAEAHGLQKLAVQMMSTQRDAQTLFHNLGFIPEALLHDWAIDRQGRTHDLIVMSREVDDDGMSPQPAADG